LVIKFRCLMNALINREKQGGKGEEATETTWTEREVWQR
jgi:hypothetical protein